MVFCAFYGMRIHSIPSNMCFTLKIVDIVKLYHRIDKMVVDLVKRK